MDSILIPVDNSEESANAVKYASHIAAVLTKEIHLINVYQIPVSYSEVPLITISVKDIEEGSKILLEKLKQSIELIGTKNVDVKIKSKYGETVEEIIKYADDIKPSMIIMGTKGVGGLERLFLGSNTISVIKKSKYPVLVIPELVKYKVIKRIGMASDFQKVVETTSIKMVRNLLEKYQASLDVLHVDYERYHFDANTPMETLNLDTLLHGLKPEYHYIENKNVTEGLVTFTLENHIDLIVVYPKKHSWFEQLFEQSETRKLVKSATIPVLCLKNLD